MTEGFETWKAADSSGAMTHEFRITRENQRDVTGAVWLPDGVGEGDALVCFGHGASGDRYQTPAPDLAARVVAAGHPFLSLEGPDHGLRQTGEGGRKGMILDLVRPGCHDEMADDWGLAVDATRHAFGFRAERLGYFGLSMGTAYGLSFVANRSDVAVATFGLWGAVDSMPQNEVMVEHARKISVPVLYLMQADDEFISRDAYLDLFETLGSEDKCLHANPGVHAEIPVDEVAYAADFLLDRLSGGNSSREMARIVDSEL